MKIPGVELASGAMGFGIHTFSSWISFLPSIHSLCLLLCWLPFQASQRFLVAPGSRPIHALYPGKLGLLFCTRAFMGPNITAMRTLTLPKTYVFLLLVVLNVALAL